MLKEIVNEIGCDSAELCYVSSAEDVISFENGKLKEAESSILNGVSLRVIKGGKLGSGFVTDPGDKRTLIKNVIDSLKGGEEAGFDFPSTKGVKEIHSYDERIEETDNEELVRECERIVRELPVEGQINIMAQRGTGSIRIVNTNGTDLTQKFSHYSIYPEVIFPDSTAAVAKAFESKRFEPYPEEDMEFIRDLYRGGKEKTSLSPGKKETLFLAEELPELLESFVIGTNGRMIFEGKSPLSDMRGEKIFDGKISMSDEPSSDSAVMARSFDDEGMACRENKLVENGVLKSFYYDLKYASRMREEPTGNGFKGDASSKPEPEIYNLTIKPSNRSFDELVSSMDDGIIVCGTLGSFAGNAYTGDFSMGVAPAIRVKNGAMIGRANGVMISGNVYEVMKDVAGIEDRLHPSFGGHLPSMLFGGVEVSGD